MDLSAIPCILMCIFQWISVERVHGIDVHVSPGKGTPRESSLIFEAANYGPNYGSGWSYHIDRNSRSRDVNTAISLDASSGNVYLKWRNICDISLPLDVRIVARTNIHNRDSVQIANYTITPLFIYVNDSACHRSKLQYQSVRSEDKNNEIVLFSNRFLNMYGAPCFLKDVQILILNHYIPYSLKNTICDVYVDIPGFVYDKTTSAISSKSVQCLQNAKVSIPLTLIPCKGTPSYPFPNHVKISIRDSKSLNTGFHVAKATNSQHRLKRQLTSPRFAKDSYEVSVPENKAIGFSVTTITATDPDDGEAGKITYKLEPLQNTLSGNMFAIDPISGIVRTTAVLDREGKVDKHLFIVTATDSSVYQYATSATLTINVEDENDNEPTFSESVYPVSVLENIPEQTTIATLRALDIDKDENGEIRYSVIEPVSQNTFRIDPTKGSITTLTKLDRETVPSYRLVVQATDRPTSGRPKSSSATVSITVLDINDNTPQFDQAAYIVNISENLDVSNKPVIGRVSAVDIDEGRNQQITYSITGGNIDSTFFIDHITGEVSVQKPIDYESLPEYRLKIKASDNGETARANSTTMWVRILDLNDNAPYFQNNVYDGTVLEGAKVATSVLQVVALDNDDGENKKLVYSIIDAPTSLPFAINPDTGLITVQGTIDRENEESYKFVVQVKDKGQPTLSTTTAVHIMVRDINDNRPIFSQKLFSISIPENTQLYKQIIKVTATDNDAGENAVLSYTIETGNNDDVFSIGKDTGTITLNSRLDFKIQNRYILNVRATDTGGQFDTAEVHINVTDINKHTPSFENLPYQMNTDEEEQIGKSIGKIQAVDSDVGENGRITYELLNNVQEFRIDHVTGVIYTREVLDRELKAAYSFDVKASDHGEPVFYDTAGVIVVVNDKNDNKPVFDNGGKPYEASISENVVDGDLVLTVHADDLDAGINAQVQYRFAADSDGISDFEIEDASGDIRVADGVSLDRERRSNYTLTVLAVDAGVVPQTGSVMVKIKIEDVNDNKPEFAQDVIVAYVAENKKIGSTVALIEATDADEGVNAMVEYSIAGGPDADKFVLNTRLGDPAIIINRIPLDYESDKKEYIITLKASSGVLFSQCTVLIKVQDVNDNSPILKDFQIIFNNYIDRFPTEPIGRVPAFDPDVSDRAKLMYGFVSGNEAGFLHLNKSSGEITLNSRLLNSDVSRYGELQVEVSDGLNNVTAKCSLYVRLITESMLRTSVTIRINNMTSDAFLSPLFTFFVEAVAIIVNVEVSDVFVINVRNDTEMASGQVLNVTIAVKEKTEIRARQRVDVFYTAEFLKEQIYLHRTLLANLSTLQVLPFDDNLCLQEMCPGFFECRSWLKFGEAGSFITSDTMLFRPIHPSNTYDCSFCPPGYTGHSAELFYYCDTEVDLCYSNPCNNSGTCIRKEGGYTCQCYDGYAGKNCEISQAVKYTESSCPADVCRPPSTCVPLIEGGFRCQGCPNNVDYDDACQLMTRSFQRGSFLMFPTLKSRYRFKIQLKFATQEKNGLLFYNGRFNELHDFVALEIVDGQVQFSFSLGDVVEKVSPYVEGGVSNGEWHMVTVDYLNMAATVTVGEDCDTEISVRFGRSINYTCAARVTHLLNASKCLPSLNCQRLLDLTGPLQVGGLPASTLPSPLRVANRHYVGCLKELHMDGKMLDFNQFIAENGTQVGCQNKKEYCKGAPCAHGGTCMEGWNTYKCLCPDGWGGKDCTTVTESARQLSGDGYLHYSNTNRLIPKVNTVWFTGLSFRTRSSTGTLMFIVEQNGENILVDLQEGYIQYTYQNSLGSNVFPFNSVRVDDGEWHDFEARWRDDGSLILILDYGQVERVYSVTSTLVQKTIIDVFVGALKVASIPADNFFTGCVKNPRVGNTQNSVLQRPGITNAPVGCTSTDHCSSSPCSARANCVSEWEGFTCECPPGTLGPNCDTICTTYNPCQNEASCRHVPGSSYTCECGQRQSGRYCEINATQPCPARWWGFPVCGPCPGECSAENGFNPNCDNLSGKCSCRADHYRPAGSDRCLPCGCYSHGSRNLTCNAVTGQCPCWDGVIGRRCNQCPSKYAEIRMDEETKKYGCKVDYVACPRVFSHEMWWETRLVNVQVRQDCPGKAVGEVTRNCTAGALWLEPDYFNCTNIEFVDHLEQLEKIESGNLKINTFVAKTTMAGLANSTAKVSKTGSLYANDLNITVRMLELILDYENRLLDLDHPQSVLDLTSEWDSQYLSNMISVLSDILHTNHSTEWERINKAGEGTAGLTRRLEKYLSTLLTALELTAADNPAPYNIITENIVLSVDTISKKNFTGKTIPKYDNIVRVPTFDDDTSIYLPPVAIKPSQSTPKASNKAYVGYILYKSLGQILPQKYGPGVRVIKDRPMAINSPLFSVLLRDEGKTVNGSLSEPVVLTFKQLIKENRASPQCVFWELGGGHWSTSGCTEADRYTVGEEMFVKCSCSHMTSFAVLMDISDKEYQKPDPVPLEVITFVGLIVCMGCLVLAFNVFFWLKRLQSNANSIHTNLVFVIFVCNLAFLVGINRVDDELWCRLVAIILHYFYMTGFSWLCVDILHAYRMLTEVRNIDQGSMKFYYLLAYVVPGIVVSLAVGLNTEGYGTNDFCWLSMSDKFIWSLAGPVTVAVIINVLLFFLAVKASCREKVSVSDLTPLRFGLFANIIILMLWGIIWIVGLLAVNFKYVGLHYLFAFLNPALGVFIVIIYIIANAKVRLELKKLWYRVTGQKLDLDDNIGGTRSSVYSRSALAYRNDSCDNGLARINVGISTTSTTSRSTSKSSGGGVYKGEDYLRSTSTSTSGNLPPVKYPAKNGLPPAYGYDPEKPDDLDPDSIQIRPKHDGNDSDSDSEMSERVSLDLASSHSSDDEDDIDVRFDWEKQLPKNKKVEEAKEQARLKQKEEGGHSQSPHSQGPLPPEPTSQATPPPIPQLPASQHQYQNPFEHIYSGIQPTYSPKPNQHQSPAGHWPGDPQLSGYTGGSDSEYVSSDRPTLSSVQPDVTLQTPEYKGREFMVTPPRRQDSLLNDSNSSSGANQGSFPSPLGSPHLKHSPQRAGSGSGLPGSPLAQRIVGSPLGSPLGSPGNRMMVKVLTHRGSVSSDSECSHETCV